MHVEITDHTDEVLAAMRAAALRGLEKCGLVAEGYAKKLCPVDTGNLRNSITHTVTNSGERAAYVGTDSEYAIYVEMGTGKYVTGGRPTPWVYKDAQGNWHMTHGQRAQPYIKPQWQITRSNIKKSSKVSWRINNPSAFYFAAV